MALSAARFGPFVVRWPSCGLDDVLIPLLGGPTNAVVPASDDAPAELPLEVTLVSERVPYPGGQEAFFLGEVRAFDIGDQILVADGASLARVAADGSSIGLRLHEGSLRPQSAFRTHGAPGMLSIAARARGVFHMHAALATLEDTPVLVVGQGHAGKTTTALSLIASGGRWGGDDLALFEADGSGVRFWGVPREFHLREATARLFPEIARLGTPRVVRGAERVDVALWRALPARRLAAAVTPEVVVVPRVADIEHTTAEFAESGATFGDLLHASAMIVADELGRQQEQLDLLGRLVSSTRHVTLRLGRDGLRDGMAAARALSRLLDQ